MSYVLTGARAVSPDREARVRTAMRELDYRPNRSAQALKTGRTGTLGVVVSDIANPFFAEFALQLEIAAAARGHAIVIVSSGARFERELTLIQDLLDRGVDGLIIGSVLAPRSRLYVQGLDTPVVWIDDTDPTSPQFNVGSSMFEGARDAVRHLVQVHHRRRVALVIGDGDRIGVDLREAGWETALHEADLPLGPRVEHSWSRSGGRAAGHTLLETADPPDAVFACSDMIGIGVLRAAADLGVRVPDDLSVASFDGTEESEYSSPALTTLRQPVPDMARAAVDAVLNGPRDPLHLRFAGELVVRESCGCASATPSPGADVSEVDELGHDN